MMSGAEFLRGGLFFRQTAVHRKNHFYEKSLEQKSIKESCIYSLLVFLNPHFNSSTKQIGLHLA